MSTILITGANKGLGRETVRRLVVEGHEVWAAARDPERGPTAAKEIRAHDLVLDVSDDASVEAVEPTFLTLGDTAPLGGFDAATHDANCEVVVEAGLKLQRQSRWRAPGTRLSSRCPACPDTAVHYVVEAHTVSPTKKGSCIGTFGWWVHAGDMLFLGYCLELDRRLKLDLVELAAPEIGTPTNDAGHARTRARVDDFAANVARAVEAVPIHH